jgi:hypothetical protein
MYGFQSAVGTHSWLTGYASRDDDDVSTLESLRKTVIWREISLNFSGCCDVREVCSYARCIDDIKEAELMDCSHSECVRWGEAVTSVTPGFVLRRRARGCPIPPVLCESDTEGEESD